MAIASLVLGIITLVLSIVPFVNLLGLLLGVIAIGLGIAGVVRSRRVQVGGVMAGFGIGTAVVGMVASVLVTVLVGKAILAFFGFVEDVTRTAEVADVSGERGQWVALEGDDGDDSDVEVRLDSVDCVAGPDGDTCTVAFQIRNGGTATESFDGDNVAAVTDDAYDSLSMESVAVGPGQTVAASGTVRVYGDDTVDAVGFNLDDVRTNSTTVIDAA